MVGRYLKNILVSLDQLINTFFRGKPDETMSSRAYKLRSKGIYWLSDMIDFIFFWEKDHCKNNVEEDE